MDKNNLISNIYHYENRSHTSFSFAPAEREIEIIETVKACGAGNGDSHVIAYAHDDGNFYACFWLRGEIIAAEHALLNNHLLEEIFTRHLATDYQFRVEDEETLWRIIATYGSGQSSITVNGANSLTMLPRQVEVSFTTPHKHGCQGMITRWLDYHHLLIDLTMLRLVNRTEPEQYIHLTGSSILSCGPHPMVPRLLGTEVLKFEDWLDRVVNLKHMGNNRRSHPSLFRSNNL